MKLNEIIREGRRVEDIISDLSQKTTNPPSWAELRKFFIPSNHKIADDKQQRRDRVVETSQGSFVEEACRSVLGLEKLLVKRVNQFTFSIPVKREYQNIDTPARKEIAAAIERIYQEVDIDTVNIHRGLDYFMGCEIFTQWYPVPKKNTLYGFNSEYKLKCRTFSPIRDNVKLYPLIDEEEDMVAFSLRFDKKIENERHTFFKSWSEEGVYEWKKGETTAWQDVSTENVIGKIPGVYLWRSEPIFEDGTPELREDTEYKHSEESDVISYNSAPLIKVMGKMVSDEKKYESRRLVRVEQGGDVSYVSWNQSTEATEKHIQRNIDWFWMMNQMPDISFKNLQSLGDIGYDARQMMLTDTYLKIGEESKAFNSFFRREGNVIKAFLKQMQTKWSDEDIDAVVIKHIITPYIPQDEKYDIQKRQLANGGKALESQRESIERWGKSDDVDKTMKEIQEEAQLEQSARITSLMEGAI